jgi:heme-degrading monooxygenase HmoA
MYARTVTAHFPPDKVDEATHLWQESVAPSLSQQKGFKKGYLLVERSTGKVVTLWETEADLQATDPWAQEQIDKFAGLFSAPASVEHYEVAVEV